VSGGGCLLQNSLDRVIMSFNSPAGVQDIQNESYAAFGQVNWHVADDSRSRPACASRTRTADHVASTRSRTTAARPS
jgi:hypothetical protein